MERALDVVVVVLVSRTTAALKRGRDDYLRFLMSCTSPLPILIKMEIDRETSQHRVSPFRLNDPTKPGHRRFIVLWLVDPHARIISTANVPPQQQNWWVDSILSPSNSTKTDVMSEIPADLVQLLRGKGLDGLSGNEEQGKLPPELIEMVREHFDIDGDALPMSRVEAEMHREKIVEVRSAFHGDADDHWHRHTYSFCEH